MLTIPGMESATVIATDSRRGLFALQSHDGACSVFSQYSGPEISAGDIITGAVSSRGVMTLEHIAGRVQALGCTGAIPAAQALDLIRRKTGRRA